MINSRKLLLLSCCGTLSQPLYQSYITINLVEDSEVSVRFSSQAATRLSITLDGNSPHYLFNAEHQAGKL